MPSQHRVESPAQHGEILCVGTAVVVSQMHATTSATLTGHIVGQQSEF